ncbi:MAG: hypothetical protein WC551_02645 [Patescibacteria group bacterium]
MPKRYEVTAEIREKMRQSALNRDDRKRLASMPRGRNHWAWQENPNNLLTLHKRLHRRYGKAKNFTCEKCKLRQAHDWANMTGNYTDNIEDYLPLCRSCHVSLDKNWIKKL